MGSSLNEGGTWIDPLMALNLAQHLSGKFALEATHILVNYFTQQGSTRKLNIQSF